MLPGNLNPPNPGRKESEMQASMQQAAREEVSGGSRGQRMAGLNLRLRRLRFKEERSSGSDGGAGGSAN